MKKNLLLFTILVLVDQISKYIIATTMEVGNSIEIIKNYFYITSHRNSGAAWGILSGQQWLFYIITLVVVIYIIRFLFKHQQMNNLLRIGLVCYLSGAVGNFIDRILFGEVVDFFDIVIPIINYDFPIFNIADMTLVSGFILIFIYILKEGKNEGV